VQLARAEAALGAARAYLYGAFADAWADALAGGTLTMQRKGQLQLVATNGVHGAAAAVDLVHAAVGATGIRCEYAFQRHFRDVHVLTQHAFVCASRYESVGRLLLGLDPEWSFFGF
jgi:alkylation response protein AidB-like acyl-CoA dehydrogenase